MEWAEERRWLQHYDPEVPHDVAIPEKTLPELFNNTVARFPGHPYLIFMGRSFSYREVKALADNFAAVLVGLGVKKGSRVALNLPNSPQFVFCLLGALQAGCTVIPFNPIYTEREIKHQLGNCEAEIMVTLSRFYPRIRQVKSESRLRTIISTNIKEYLPRWLQPLYTLFREKSGGDRIKVEPGDYHLPALMKKYGADPVPAVRVDPDFPACIMYTGGTTGLPKGAILTHRNLVANIVTFYSWIPDMKEAQEIGVAQLPFFHAYGLSTCLTLTAIYCGTLLLFPEFEVKTLLKTIHRYKPTLFPGVPTMYIALVNHPDLKKYDLSSLRICVSGAAAMPLEVLKTFEELTGCRMLEGYGLTEATTGTHFNPCGKRKIGSVGLPLPGTWARIVDLDDPDREMEVGAVGQMAVKGPQITPGYLNNPEETEKVMHRGWLLTGDLARMDEDGYFYIVDRQKEMIISGGYNIYPREIEEVLYAHEKIKEAAVLGLPHPYRGEIAKAFLVLREGETMTEKEVLDYCKQELAIYKVPHQIEFRPSLPLSLVGKVLKRLLREEELARQEQEDALARS